jgi:ferredoxin
MTGDSIAAFTRRMTPMTDLQSHLAAYDPAAWQRAVGSLSVEVHPIDREAMIIWFAFYPLELHLALAETADLEAAARRLGLMGTWRLNDQIDRSHRFFYAHRYWPQVKSAVQNAEAPFPSDLAELASTVAISASRRARVDREFLLGIAAAGLMTYRQVGAEAFAQAPGRIHLPDKARAMSPHQVMKKRARDDAQGVFGFARGPHKRWTVTFDESDPGATFTLINGQEIASAAQTDKRDYTSADPRCIRGEGPIPVECRAASCGTCWVGVLGGAEKLSAVVDRDERRRMTVFGYTESTEERPLIRLACQARAFGAVSIVIPPWNGLIGPCRAERR